MEPTVYRGVWHFIPRTHVMTALKGQVAKTPDGKPAPAIAMDSRVLQQLMTNREAHHVLSLEDQLAVLRMVQGFLFEMDQDGGAYVKLRSLPMDTKTVRLEWPAGRKQDIWPLVPARDGWEAPGTKRVSLLTVRGVAGPDKDTKPEVLGLLLQVPAHVVSAVGDRGEAEFIAGMVKRLHEFEEDEE